MDWNRHTSPTSADQSHPSAADRVLQRLRSTTRGDLVVCSYVTHFGTRAFAVAGPKAWNQLPMHQCTYMYEHGRQLDRKDITKGTFPLR